MSHDAPKLIWIKHDDHNAKYVGRTTNGQQFFLTTPFVPANDDTLGHEFIALYLFDAHGRLTKVVIDDLGVREHIDDTIAHLRGETRLTELGELTLGDIVVAPFRVKRFGIEFGLIAIAPTVSNAAWSVIAQPGNYMAFYPPWDGEYDT